MPTLADWGNAVAKIRGKPQHWIRYCEYLFRGISFAGKSVLDIGGGVGRFSYYAAVLGARRVVCVEPEAAGSRNTMLDDATALGESLGLSGVVEFVTDTIEAYYAPGEFDVIISHNSINHIDETACSRLHCDNKALAKYAGVIDHIGSLAASGARLVLSDASRENLFADLPVRNPFSPTVDWKIHQTPELWAGLFGAAGFRDPIIRWTPDRRSGAFGELVLTNRFAAWCLQSHFCLTMTK